MTFDALGKVLCQSSHGGMSYAPQSYWDGNAIVCGECGEEILNPRPTIEREVHDSLDEVSNLRWLLLRLGLVSRRVVKVLKAFPAGLQGAPGVAWQGERPTPTRLLRERENQRGVNVKSVQLPRWEPPSWKGYMSSSSVPPTTLRPWRFEENEEEDADDD